MTEITKIAKMNKNERIINASDYIRRLLLKSEILKRAVPLLLTKPAFHPWMFQLWSLNKARLMWQKLHVTMQVRTQMQIQKRQEAHADD